MPCFVIREWLGGDDGYAIVVGGQLTEIHADILILEVGHRKGSLTDEVVKPGRGVGKKRIPLAQQEIELAMCGDKQGNFLKGCKQAG